MRYIVNNPPQHGKSFAVGQYASASADWGIAIGSYVNSPSLLEFLEEVCVVGNRVSHVEVKGFTDYYCIVGDGVWLHCGIRKGEAVVKYKLEGTSISIPKIFPECEVCSCAADYTTFEVEGIYDGTNFDDRLFEVMR